MKNLKQQNLALFASLTFLVLVVGGFFWLWKTAQPADDSIVLDETYNTVEIGSVKQAAQTLIQSKSNLVQMPLQSPTTVKNRENPFAGL